MNFENYQINLPLPLPSNPPKSFMTATHTSIYYMYHTLCRGSSLQPEWISFHYLSAAVNQLMCHTDVSCTCIGFIYVYHNLRSVYGFGMMSTVLICFYVIKLFFSLLYDLSTFHYKIHNKYWDFVSILFKINFADCCQNKLLVDTRNSWQCLCDSYPGNALNNLFM